MNKHTYTLEAIVNGDYIKVNHLFKSRDEAINYIFHYYEKHLLTSLRVDEEYFIDGNKHDVEYVCDYYNRFRIMRA